MTGKINLDHYKGLNIAVTGGAGFIGSHITEKLLNLGAKVTVIDTFLHGNKVEHLAGHKQLSIHEADIRNSKSMSTLLKNKDMVFHLAAVVGVEETQLSPFEVLDVEIGGTINLLNASTKNNVKKFIFGSSSEVYGDSREPMNEDSRLAPKSTYAVAKLVGEEYCKAFFHKYNLHYTILRYFNVYGPRQDERFVISRFIKRALASETIFIYGDGKQTRDFTYVDDTVNVTLLASINDKTSCQAINIGTGNSTSINDLASQIMKSVNNKTMKLQFVEYDKTRPREIEIFNRTADITKAKKMLHYDPTVNLAEGLKNLISLDKRFKATL
jgi:UDP-glucose 4-epimerase